MLIYKKYFALFLFGTLCLSILLAFNSGCSNSEQPEKQTSNLTERQAILNYITSITPIRSEYVEIVDDFNKLTGVKQIDTAQWKSGWLIVKGRITEVQKEIENSSPPEILIGYQNDWIEQCQMISEISTLILEAINTPNKNKLEQADSLIRDLQILQRNSHDNLGRILRKNNISL